MKKAAVPLAVIVIFIVLAVFFFIYASGILSEGGILRKSASAVDEAIQKVPGVGDEEIDRIQLPPTPKEVQSAFDSLARGLNSNTAKAPCIAEYGERDNKGGLQDLKGYTIEFLRRSEAGSDAKFIIQLRVPAPDGRIADIQYVNNGLCVVGGILPENTKISVSGSEIAQVKGGKVSPTTQNGFKNTKDALGFGDNDLKIAASNFYYNWIADIDRKSNIKIFYLDLRKIHQRILAPDYTKPRHIMITNKDEMQVDYGSGLKPFGKEDGGLLYVPEEGKVCVFGTFYAWGGACVSKLGDGYNDKGLDKHCPAFIVEKKRISTC